MRPRSPLLSVPVHIGCAAAAGALWTARTCHRRASARPCCSRRRFPRCAAAALGHLEPSTCVCAPHGRAQSLPYVTPPPAPFHTARQRLPSLPWNCRWRAGSPPPGCHCLAHPLPPAVIVGGGAIAKATITRPKATTTGAAACVAVSRHAAACKRVAAAAVAAHAGVAVGVRAAVLLRRRQQRRGVLSARMAAAGAGCEGAMLRAAAPHSAAVCIPTLKHRPQHRPRSVSDRAALWGAVTWTLGLRSSHTLHSQHAPPPHPTPPQPRARLGPHAPMHQTHSKVSPAGSRGRQSPCRHGARGRPHSRRQQTLSARPAPPGWSPAAAPAGPCRHRLVGVEVAVGGRVEVVHVVVQVNECMGSAAAPQ